MKFQQNTGKSIQQAFEDYHRLNPKVYIEFIRFAMEAIKKGKKKISAKLIVNRIRWEIYMVTEEPTLFNDGVIKKAFRLNDAYQSRYARMFIEDFPEHKDIFEFRRLRS